MTKIKEGTSSKGKKLHYSVGALIERNGKYLLIDRASFPYGFACVAGHINEGESAEQALKREVFEEIGANVKKFSLVFENEFENNTCRKGADVHYWYIFKVEFNGKLKADPKEVKSIGWYSLDEIKKLNSASAFNVLFKKIGIL